MKKVILAAALCVGVAATSAAQEVKFGARAGLNVSKLKFENESTDSRVGFHLGAVADIKLMDMLYFQPGAMLSLKGGKESNGNTTVKMNATYLELPLMLSGKLELNSDLAVRANFGPYIGLGLGGQYKAEANDNEQKQDLFSDDFLKRFDLGLGIGAGVEYTQFYLGLGYNFGLTNISQDDDGKAKNGTFYISVGYNF